MATATGGALEGWPHTAAQAQNMAVSLQQDGEVVSSGPSARLSPLRPWGCHPWLWLSGEWCWIFGGKGCDSLQLVEISFPAFYMQPRKCFLKNGLIAFLSFPWFGRQLTRGATSAATGLQSGGSLPATFTATMEVDLHTPLHEAATVAEVDVPAFQRGLRFACIDDSDVARRLMTHLPGCPCPVADRSVL